MRTRLATLVLIASIALLGAFGCGRSTTGSSETAQIAPSPGAYADPAECALCHSEIAATYQKTGMARAFHHVGGKKSAGDPAPGKTYHHVASDSYFAMVQRNGELFQRRWQIGPDGKETNVDEKRVDYVLGSGNHARTYLHLTEKNTLQQLPLGWYAEKGGIWAMNPGYDRPDYAGSVRPIYYECMFCHNGYPRIPNGKDRDMAETKYLQPLPEGIDCQRCHGPGQNHVDKASSANIPREEVRAAILNPGKLNPERAMEVCLQCHLETSNQKLPTEVVRLNRIPFSYVAGQPLGDYQVSFDREKGNLGNFEIAQGAYRLRESQCFRKSEGKLLCTTCHNPHDIPRGEQAVAHYNQVCLNCHQSKVQASAAAPHKAGANCVSCHMPKRRTDDAIHVVMTEHLIPRQPAGDLLAEKKERAETGADSYQGEVVPYYPSKLPATADNELTIAVAQVREKSNLAKGVPQLAAVIEKYRPEGSAYYAELAEGHLAAGNTTAALQFFEEAAKRDPQSAPRLIAWGDALMQAGQWPLAEAKLRRATELAPDDVRGWGRLGWALWQQNKAGEARSALEKGIRLDPEVPELHNNLGLLFWGTGDQAGAEKEFRAAIRIQPGVTEWRLTLARVLASQGRTAEARFQLEQVLRWKPGYAEARVDYARVLGDMNRPAEAEAQAKLAVESDPRSSAGHELWGGILAAKGDFSGARRELSEAVRLQPGNARARMQLGMVLANLGDRAGAISHLAAAAQAPDPNIRAAATQALQTLNAR